MHWFIEILLLVSLLLYLLHLYVSKNFDYWKKRNVPFLKPSPFVGNMMDMLLQKYEMGRYLSILYEQMDAPFFGIFVFSKPALIIRDAEILKHILVTDFDHFVDRNLFAPEFDPAVAHMLFTEKGQEWKTMRAKMSPFFSPSKTKYMFGHIDNSAKLFRDYIVNKKEKTKLDIKDISCKYTVDVIAKCVFSADSRSLVDDDAEFTKIAYKIFDTRRITCFRYLCYFFYHPFARLFRMRIFDSEVIGFLRKLIWECIKVKEETQIRGNDMMDIIVELRKNKEFCERYKFEGDKVIAQGFIFFVAGFETTGSAIAFTFYALSLNPDIQRKLRNNIKEVMKKHNGQLDVNSIEEMKYLDLVVKEVLRLWPPAPTLDRVCTADYKIPGTDVTIDKGTIILMPSLGLHKDPKHFTNPEEFRPERFENLDEDSIAYLPFGHGPRRCIGTRFGNLMVKLAIVRVLQEFEVHRNDETPVPVVFSPTSVIPQPTKKLSVDFVRVDPLF